jgi:NADP-reducing hydrogenase subunit HndB
MAQIKSLADLKKKREELLIGPEVKLKEFVPGHQVQVKVAMATCGIASGAKPIMEFFVEQLDRRSIPGVVKQITGILLCRADN